MADASYVTLSISINETTVSSDAFAYNKVTPIE